MSDEFVAFLKEKKGATLSLCNITINELGDLVTQFMRERSINAANLAYRFINWKDTRNNLPPADKSLEWAKCSKRLLLYLEGGLMIFGRYHFEEHAYRAEGTGVEVKHVTHFTVAQKPAEFQKGDADD